MEFASLVIAGALCTCILAADVLRDERLCSDEFSRDEAPPDKKDIGNGWTTNNVNVWKLI